MDDMVEVFQKTVMGINLMQYGIAFLFILAGYICRLILLGLINKGVRLARKTSHDYDDVILEALHKPISAAAVIGGIWLAVGVLALPEEPVNISRFVHSLLKSGFVLIAIWLGLRLTNGVARVLMEKAAKTPSPLDDQLVPVGRNTLKVFLVVIGSVVILQDLGYSVSSLLAGLGLGGMAIALASKDTLANLFGGVVIFIDRPFTVGDWVEMNDIEGTVEEVGLRVTRIRTFANSLITLPNSQLTITAINNWSRMKKRRIKLYIGVTYETNARQVEEAVEAIRKVVREDKKIDQDFWLVNFNRFGAYSLDIFVYCFTITTNWSEYLQARQEILLKFMDAIQQLGLEFAFPTQTIHVAGDTTETRHQGEPDAMSKEVPE